MDKQRMMRLCKGVLEQVDQLETVLSHLSERDKPFIYEARSAAVELHHVAKYETSHTMTREQVSHINSVCGQLERIYEQLPPKVLRQLEDDDKD